MSSLADSDMESARRREDVLRELNLFPQWQLREAPAVTPQHHAKTADSIEAAAETLQIEPEMTAEVLIDHCDQLNWSELKQRVEHCSACDLRAGCTQTVFGTGDESADWLFVGSWPTEDDDTQGEPFAGQAGQLLDNMLAAIKLKRGINVYLANVVKCTGSIRRGPKAEQIAQCTPYLMRQIQLIKPKMIVVLGHAAATAMLGEDREWGSLLGKAHEFCGFEKVNLEPAIPLIITHHPAALLLTPLNKAQTWRDLCLARDTMLGLVSDK